MPTNDSTKTTKQVRYTDGSYSRELEEHSAVSTGNLGMWLPSLPHPYALHALQEQWVESGKRWIATIYTPTHQSLGFTASGKSPREAILRCLDKREAHYEQD